MCLTISARCEVSVLFNEPKLLKFDNPDVCCYSLPRVSVLFNEPKLLKFNLNDFPVRELVAGFSALQRAEIAEMNDAVQRRQRLVRFSALQRAEIAEM